MSSLRCTLLSIAGALGLGVLLLAGCGGGGDNGIKPPAPYSRYADPNVAEQAHDVIAFGGYGSGFRGITIDASEMDIATPESILDGLTFSGTTGDWYPIAAPAAALTRAKTSTAAHPATGQVAALVNDLAQLTLRTAVRPTTRATETTPIDFTDHQGITWTGTIKLTDSSTATKAAMSLNVQITGTRGHDTFNFTMSGKVNIGLTGASLSGKFDLTCNMTVTDAVGGATHSLFAISGGTVSASAKYTIPVELPAARQVEIPDEITLKNASGTVGLDAIVKIDGKSIMEATLRLTLGASALDTDTPMMSGALTGQQLLVAEDGYWLLYKESLNASKEGDADPEIAGTLSVKASDGYVMTFDAGTRTGTVKDNTGTVVANLTFDTAAITLTIDYVDPEIEDIVVPFPALDLSFLDA